MLPFLCFGPKRTGIFNAIVNIGSISPCPEDPLCFPIRHDFRTCCTCVGQAAFDKLLCIDNHVHGVFRRFYFLSLKYLLWQVLLSSWNKAVRYNIPTGPTTSVCYFITADAACIEQREW